MAFSLIRCTANINAAFVAGGAKPGNPFLIAMSAALANAVRIEVENLEVDGAQSPAKGGPMLAPAGGGPVTGKGRIT